MKTPTWEEAITEILANLGNYWFAVGRGENHDQGNITEKEALAAINKAVLELVIGEDEELGADGLRRSDGADINNLRAAQRRVVRGE